jgi:hypothetical protein
MKAEFWLPLLDNKLEVQCNSHSIEVIDKRKTGEFVHHALLMMILHHSSD